MKQPTRSHSPRQGFTLIELSLVIVIIGLIVGGFVGMQNLIHTAQLRQIMSTVDQYKSSINAFQLKYGGLPGDFRTASSFFGDMPATCSWSCNGDGNGRISDQEAAKFMVHMSKAGLIEGEFTGAWIGGPEPGRELGVVPGCKSCFFKPFYHNPASSSYYVRTGHGIGLKMVNASHYGDNTMGLPTADAKTIDTKMDDGLPLSGKVYGNNYSNCILNGEYRNNSNPRCGMIFYWD